MTVKELLAAVADASDSGVPKVGVFQPSITGATIKKRGDTTITLKLVTNEFTPSNVLDGMVCWLAIGTVEALKKLQDTLEPTR